MIGGVTALSRDVPPYFLVAGNPAQPYGLNSVGLRRAAFSAEVVAELKECYRLVYRSGLTMSQALDAMRGTVATEEGRHLIAFLEAESERGIVK
jgi:UDP-N-acetylglucosamine acyltransferase